VIPGVTDTCGQVSVAEDRPGSLSEHGVRLRSLDAVRVYEWQRREAQAGKADRIKSGLVIEVEDARDPREAGAGLGDQAELLGEGGLWRGDLHVDDGRGPAVFIEKIVSARVTVGGDAHEARPVEVVCDFQAGAVLTVIAFGVKILIRVVVPRSGRKTAVREW